MKTAIIFKLFAGEFNTQKDADAFLTDIEKVCKKHDPKATNIQYTYEKEN